MMKSSKLEKDQRKKKKEIEENIIKDVKNFFRIKKEIDETAIKYVKNLFRLKWK